MKGVHMATRAATKTRDAEVEVEETVTVAADETTKPAAKKAGAKAAPKKATAKAGTAKTAAKKQTAPKGKATDDDDLDDDAEVEIDDEEVVAAADDTEATDDTAEETETADDADAEDSDASETKKPAAAAPVDEPLPSDALVLRAVDEEDDIPVYSTTITGATADPVK